MRLSIRIVLCGNFRALTVIQESVTASPRLGSPGKYLIQFNVKVDMKYELLTGKVLILCINKCRRLLSIIDRGN